MRYAEIVNGTLQSIHDCLPKNWKNVSNFDQLSTERLIDLAWSGNDFCCFWEVADASKPSCNLKTHKVISRYELNFEEKKAVEIWDIVPLTEIELQTIHQQQLTNYGYGWDNVRAQRNMLLSSCDWTVMPDSPLSAEQRAAWIAYRQQLRDLPQQVSSPENVVFPTPPSGNS